MTKQKGKKSNKLLSRLGLASGIKRRWFINNISVLLVAIIAISAVIATAMTYYFYTSVESSLQIRANSTAKTINRYMSDSYSQFYDYSKRVVQDFSEADKLEMQIIDVSGRVMFSSTGITAGFIPATDEVGEALRLGQTRTYTGYDVLTDERVMSTTAPVLYQNGRIIGAVRYVTSLKILTKQLSYIYLSIVGIAVLISTLVIVSNTYFLRSIVNPIIKINGLAQKITGGQYGVRLDAEFNDEIGELCETMNNMSQELGRMNKMENEFISSVSHELRTPLTAINGWAETISNDLGDTELAQSGLEIIKKETRRLSQMVEELLDFSRIQGGSLKLHTESFDLRGELFDAVYIYNDMLKQENLTVRYEEMPEPVQVFADRNRLRQVFLNIIDNAAKYGKDGDFIDISLRKQDGMCIARFKDYGQGIPAEELPFVKEKFFKGSARGRGTGIGLAVCTEIVTLHGGSLDVESVYGEGTEVIITLPLDETNTGE